MFKNEFDISLLIAQYVRGEISEQEQIALNNWLAESKANQNHFNTLVDEYTLSGKLVQFNSPDKEAIWNKTLKGITVTPRVKTYYQLNRYAAIAAVLLLVSAVVVLFFNILTGLDQSKVDGNGIVVPGGNKAYLTLADGKTISLTDASNGELAAQAGISIRKTADGQLVYKVEESGTAKGKMNKVSTPKGGQYQIVLPDGSKVWLNAASELSFPTSFAGVTDRMVELKGEAYFEVAKDKVKPFIVKSDGQDVEVMGTHFNINAYRDEERTRTTLLEGSVKVSSSEKVQEKVLLKPNQQAILKENKFTVVPADPEAAVDWKNGYFSFDKESLPAIMRKISRWYDVEIVYQDNYTGNDFTGFVSRKKEVSEVLELLELTGLVHFKTEGRRITVMP